MVKRSNKYLNVKQNGFALNFASNELKNDEDCVIEAVSQNGLSLKYASKELKNNKIIILEAVKRSNKYLKIFI